MNGAAYQTLAYNSRLWVRRGERLLGAYSANSLRSYVFPLYTPGGTLVLQEAPPDHLHHQGLFVGLSVDGYDLWNAGSGTVPRHRQIAVPQLCELTPVVSSDGVTIKHSVSWTTVTGDTLVPEQRTIVIGERQGCTCVTWRSVFGPAPCRIELNQTKEAGIGMRVPPHWETVFGGKIRNAHGAEGETGCFDRDAAWLNVEGHASGTAVAGVVFAPAAGTQRCPWFTRDYGLHVYNPLRHHPVSLATGASYSLSVCLVAYDGARNAQDIHRLIHAVLAA